LSSLAQIIATWFGCGYAPKGPGTAGSLAAIAIAWLLTTYAGVSSVELAWLAVLLAIPGIWAADVVARSSGVKDPQVVVVDEVVGQWMTLAGATTLNWKSWLLALALFRLFDIWKPPPVRQLEKLGVEVRASALVTGINPGEVWVGNEKIPAAVVLWAAGVAASPLGKKLGVPTDRAGRVPVNGDLSLPQHPEVFVIGDLATLKDKQGNPLPGVAPVAIQEGRAVAKTIAGDLQNAPRKDFHYVDKGSLATIGRAAAIAQFGKLHVSGYFAWLAWLFVHVLFLIGFRNRLIVMLQWAWSYLTYERGARLITGDSTLPGWTKPEEEQEPRLRPTGD
jgi:phosphatidylglycerophosphatase A